MRTMVEVQDCEAIHHTSHGPSPGVSMAILRYNDLKLEADRKASELREALDVMNAIKVRRDTPLLH